MFRKPLQALLIENNPYDRAVIDCALRNDEGIELRYTLPDVRGSLDLNCAHWKECLPKGKTKPDVVLLDLALSAKCEEELPKAEFQQRLKGERGNIRALIAQLENEANNMEPVVRANHWLCQALANDGPGGSEALGRLVDDKLPHEVYQRMQDDLVSFKKSGTPSHAMIESARLKLWRGRKVIANVAKLISRVPSLWGILTCIARNPDVCFFIVSHYAGPMIEEPLKDILAARTEPPSSDTDFYARFIVNKANLQKLGKRLIVGHEEWLKLRSRITIGEPFALYPVLTPRDKWLHFHEVLQQWRKEHSVEDFSPTATVLWDMSGVLEGGAPRWEAIVKTWGLNPAVLCKRPSAARAPDNNILVIEPDPLISPQGGVRWASSTKKLLAAHQKTRNETIIVVRGTQNAYAAAKNQLADSVAYYRIPPFHDAAFSKILPLENLVEQFRVCVLEEDKFHVHRWDDSPGLFAEERPLRHLLANYAPGAEERIRDRVVAYLKRESKKAFTSLEPLFGMLEQILRELKLTAGHDQDPGEICSNAGLGKAEDESEGFW